MHDKLYDKVLYFRFYLAVEEFCVHILYTLKNFRYVCICDLFIVVTLARGLIRMKNF